MALGTHLLLANSMNSELCHLFGLLVLSIVSFSVSFKEVSAAADLCQFSAYSLESQDALNSAKARIAPIVGKTYDSYDGVDQKYTVGICTKVMTDNNADAAVVQYKLQGDKITDPRVIGSLKDTHIVIGSDWIMLEYRGGDTYGNHCSYEHKRSVIMIACDPDVDDSQVKMIFLREERDKKEQCYYLFEMKHSAVCPIILHTTSLSVGSLLIIIFFSVVAVYLILGFLYTRFVLHAKGIEQVPNYEFWKDFGNLQADGCDFVCRSKGRRHVDHFGGIGDDQLEPSDEIRDDHLLPM